jgi:accessory gene regulator protein AgrB
MKGWTSSYANFIATNLIILIVIFALALVFSITWPIAIVVAILLWPLTWKWLKSTQKPPQR